jgi:hypothetical protein
VKDPTTREGIFFRRRFRLPFPIFERLMSVIREMKWYNEDHRCRLLELKVLAVLRRLGRGGPFDDCWDGSGMDGETARVFFHDFCAKFSSTLYHVYVQPPTTSEDIKNVTTIYKLLGFPGAVGSIDCVHVRWDKCPFSLRSSCSGKEGYPTLAYEACVDHSKKILSVTQSHYGARNDKTIVRYDEHVMNVRNGDLYADEIFHLYDEHGVPQEQKGLYLICDGGYHKWSCLQCPMKHTTDLAAAHFSTNLESVRKDVEDVFGILKQRFRILKHAVELHNQEQIDNVFFTCCILHNILHHYDGFVGRWDNYVRWANEDPDAGGHDDLYDGPQQRSMRARADVRVQVHAMVGYSIQADDTEYTDEYQILRRKLIIHHSISAKKKELCWLT